MSNGIIWCNDGSMKSGWNEKYSITESLADEMFNFISRINDDIESASKSLTHIVMALKNAHSGTYVVKSNPKYDLNVILRVGEYLRYYSEKYKVIPEHFKARHISDAVAIRTYLGAIKSKLTAINILLELEYAIPYTDMVDTIKKTVSKIAI